MQANCGKPAEVEALVKAATDQFGGLDVLVNNAGITRDTLMMRMKPEQWQEVIDVNLSGVFYATQVRGDVVLRVGLREFLAAAYIYPPINFVNTN